MGVCVRGGTPTPFMLVAPSHLKLVFMSIYNFRQTKPTDAYGGRKTTGYTSQYYLDDYMKRIEKYKGTDYYDRMLANPYLNTLQQGFAPNLLQRVGEDVFGDDSARMRWYSSKAEESDAYLADLISQYEAQMYESAPNQAALNQAAGLNMALGAGVSSPAAENDELLSQAGTPMSDESSVLNVIQVASQGIQGLISNAFNLVSSLQDYQMKELQLAGAEISNHGSAMDFLIKELTNTVSLPDGLAAALRRNDGLTDDEIALLDTTLLTASEAVDWSGFSRRTRKMMDRYFRSLRQDPLTNRPPMALQNLRARFLDEYTNHMTNAAQRVSHSYWSDSFNTFIGNIAREVTNLTDNLETIRTKADTAIAQNDYDHARYRYSEGNLAPAAGDSPGTIRAKTEATDVYETSQRVAFYNAINDSFTAMEKDLEKYSDSWFYPAIRLGLPMVKAMTVESVMGLFSGK